MNTKAIVMLCLAMVGSSMISLGDDSNAQKLKEGLRAFGMQQYGKALPVLEDYQQQHAADAPMFFYYVGECHYHTNNIGVAREWLLKATSTPFNQEEAYGRLAQIAESYGQAEKAHEYQQCLKQRADSLAKDRPTWTNQRIEELRKQKKVIYAGGGSFGPEGYSTGYKFLSVEWYEDAIWNYEYGLTHGVPLPSRFSVPEAALMYKALAKAYSAQAASLKKSGAAAEKLSEVERLARHNEWRLFITETRIGTNWVERVPGYGGH